MSRESVWMPDEADWSQLIDESELSSRREAAEREYADLSSDQITHLRVKAKTDLFFLAYGILGYDLMSPKLHGHLTGWLEDTRDERYRMILLPRGHYKSTVETISESVQTALPVDSMINQKLAYPFNLGPEVKLLIGHENRESAARFLFEIAEAFMKKPLMLALFPECIPSYRKQRINKWELELPRKSNSKEPTFDTIGAGGAAQGRHYNRLKLDDIIGEKARESETIMGRTLDWFDNINSLLTRLKLDGWDLVGTRWSAADVYAHAQEQYGVRKERSVLRAYSPDDVEKLPDGNLAVYARGAIENTEPIFPEEFAMEDFEVLRKNRKVWAAQYANNPKDSDMIEFDPEWLNYYNVSGQDLILFTGETRKRVNVWDLDRLIFLDPSVGETDDSDEFGLVVTGTDRYLNIYILETIKARHIPPKLVDLLFRLQTKWAPRMISIEEVAFSAMYRYWIEEKQKNTRHHLNIHPYKPGSRRTKDARIRGLTNYFAAGQVYISRGMHDFLDEYEWFPLGKSKHLLDALAQGPELWAPNFNHQQMEDRRRAEELVLDNRDALTGY